MRNVVDSNDIVHAIGAEWGTEKSLCGDSMEVGVAEIRHTEKSIDCNRCLRIIRHCYKILGDMPGNQFDRCVENGQSRKATFHLSLPTCECAEEQQSQRIEEKIRDLEGAISDSQNDGWCLGDPHEALLAAQWELSRLRAKSRELK